MNRLLSMLTVSALSVTLIACAENGTKQNVGTLLGAGAGAVLGSQVGSGRGQLAGVAIGTLLGAGLGASVGKSLDRADQLAMQQSMNHSLERGPSGQRSEWRNPDSGHSGSYTPQPAYRASSGQTCREFQQTVTIDGREQSAYGTACRMPDGSWQIQNS